MADISDIVLRIRVDIVNTKAIAGLVNSLAAATTAVRTNSRAQVAASKAQTQAASAAQKVETARSNQQIKVSAAQQKLSERVANAKANYEKKIAAAAERSASAQRTTAERLASAQQRINTRVTKAAERNAAAQRATVSRLAAAKIKMESRVAAAQESVRKRVQRAQDANTRRAVTAAKREAREAEQAVSRAKRVASENERAANRTAKAQTAAAKAADLLYQKNKKMYSISSLAGKAMGKIGAAASKVIDPLSKMERKMDAVFRAGVHMQSMGRDLLGFAKKMVGIGKELVTAWGDFEFTLNRAAAAADIFEPQSEIYGLLKQSVYDLAKELRVFPAEEVAKGLYFWQSTTGEVIETQDDLRKTTEAVSAVMKVAAMTDTGYEAAIKGVYATLKQFNMTTKETADVSALLFYATQKTALEFPDLINSLKMVGSIAGIANEPLNTMVGVLGAIGNAGIRGSMAGRALRQTYRKITKPTAAARVELDKLFKAQGGYNKVAFTAKGEFIGMEKYINKLAKATKGWSFEQKGALMGTITTANEQGVMMQMIRMATDAQDAGAKSWVEFAASQEKANLTFSKSWDILANSWRGVIGGLKQSVQPIMLEVGKVIADLLTPALQELADVAYGMGPAIQEMAEGLAETFRPLVRWITKSLKVAAEWAKNNKKVVAAFAKYAVIGTIIAGVSGAFLLLAGTVSLLIANLAIVLFGALPLIAVFVAAGVAIAAFAAGVYRNVGGIRTAMDRFGAAVLRAFKVFFGGSEDAEFSMQDLTKAFMDLSDSITSGLADILNRISGALERLTPEQAQTIWKVVKALLALKALNTGLGITMGIINGLTGNIKLMATGMARATPKIRTFLGAFSPSKIKTAITGMSNLATSVTKSVLMIAAAVGGGGLMAVRAAAGGLLVAVKFVGGFILGLASMAGSAIVAAVGWPVIIIAALVAAVVAAIAAAYATNFLGFRDFVDGIGRWITGVAIPAVMKFGQDIATNFGLGVAAVQKFVADVVAWIADIPNKIGTFISDVITNISTFVSDFQSMVGTFLEELLTNWDEKLGYILGVIVAFPIRVLAEIFTFGANLWTMVDTFLRSVWDNFSTWFATIIGDLIEWFVVNIPIIAGKAAQFVAGIIDWIASLPGKIAQFFEDIIVDVLEWFATNIPIIVGKAEKLVTDIIDWFGKLPGKIAGFFGSVIGNMIAWFATNIPLIVAEAEKLINGIVDWFKALPGNIGLALSGLPLLLIGVFTGLAKAGGDLINSVIKVGKDIVKGIWKGINDTLGWLADKVGNFFGGFINGIKDTLGIDSPSKVMAGIGDYMILGLAKGISSADYAKNAMDDVLSDVTNAASDTRLKMDSTMGGTLSQKFSTDATRTVELKVDVTSTDGSVNNVDMETLAGLITGSDMTRTLERMSTVD